MNSRIKNIIGMAVVFVGLTACSVFAQETRGGGGRLVGTWDAVVTLSDCETGEFQGSFSSIASFNQGGTSIGSTAGIPQSLRTPEHGVWRHIGGNTYAFRFKSFNFLPTGAPNGWTIVEHTLELAQDNRTYTSSGIGRIYNTSGVEITQRCTSAVGTRFELN